MPATQDRVDGQAASGPSAWERAYFALIPVVELGDQRIELVTSASKLRRLLTDVLDA